MKKYLLSIVSLVISVMCIVSYSVIGSEVLADGTVKEPFFLIPLAYLFLLIAIILAIVVFIRSKIKH